MRTGHDIPEVGGIFAGPGEARRLARAVDWRATPLGPVESWPQALRGAVRLCLDTLAPMAVWAGPELALVCNDAYLPVLGERGPWAMGRPARDVWAEVWDALGAEFAQVMQTGLAFRHEDAPFRLLRHGREEEAFFTYNFTPIREDDGRVVGVMNACEETTRSLQARSRSEQRYRSLFDSIDEGFCIIEVLFAGERPVDYRILEANPAFEKQTGLRGAVGRRVKELVPDQEEHWFEVYGRVARTGEATRFELPSQGLGRFFDVYAFRVGDPAERRVAVLFSDVTERRRAEEALRDADRRKNEFLAVLSHELRNPLAPIRNSIYLLERAAQGSEQAARARDVLRRQTEHLSRLVDDLLDVTRISRGKIMLEPTRVDLRGLVRRTTDDLRSVFSRARIELRVDPGPSAPVWIDADPTRMAQVIGNLLQNSVKFTPDGGTVTVSLAGAGGRAELRVRDDGVGMDPATVEHMFEPFAQAEPTLARGKGGLGLGLALVKGIVELHGGTVRARSEGRGRGAEFVIALPLADAGAGAEEGGGGPAPGRRRRILVIEDNLDAGQSLSDVLELHGHEVSLASDGRSGLALARELVPDVVLCDIGLPDMNGYEVARALRLDGALRGARIVALSGYAQPEDRRRALAAGFDAHLAKPPDLHQLMGEVEKER